jgi:hypothetical protein
MARDDCCPRHTIKPPEPQERYSRQALRPVRPKRFSIILNGTLYWYPLWSGEVGDKLVEQVGELAGCLLVGGVPGAGDQLHAAAPQARDGQLPQVIEVHQLLALALQDRQGLPEDAPGSTPRSPRSPRPWPGRTRPAPQRSRAGSSPRRSWPEPTPRARAGRRPGTGTAARTTRS